jgi:hypothetical protein
MVDRMTDDPFPDPIREPSPDASEAEVLVFALDRARATFWWKTSGLVAADLARSCPPSTMTIGGLVKHLALVEDHYTAVALTGGAMGAPWDSVDPGEWPDWEWRSAAYDAPEELYALWRGAAGRSRTAVAALLAKHGLDQPTLLTTASGESPNLRRLLIDLHEEYARHVGHADLLREAIDGLVGEDPPRDT